MINRYLDFLGSLKLAMFLMITIALVITVGTFVESGFGTAYAQYYIYRSAWFGWLLFMLFGNVLVSALQRLPYKHRLLGFYMSHVGILVLLIGAFITQQWGIDGSLELLPQKANHLVELSNSSLHVQNGGLQNTYPLPPSVWNTLANLMGHDGSQPQLIKYLPFAKHVEQLVAAIPAQANTNGYRFQIQSAFFKQQGQIIGPGFGERDKIFFGPLTLVHLGRKQIFPKNKIPQFDIKVKILFTYFDESNQLKIVALDHGTFVDIPLSTPLREYASAGQAQHPAPPFANTLRRGKPSTQHPAPSTSIATLPWMGITFTVLESLPYAQLTVDYQPVKPADDPDFSAATLVEYQGQRLWVASDQNQPTRFGSDEHGALLWLSKDQLRLPFSVRLDHFHMELQPGSDQPASFESYVTVNDNPSPIKIFMNHPLKKSGFMLYQASYFPLQENMAQPEYGSVLSVNRDPGRWLKYLGSLLIVLGIVVHWTWCKKLVNG